MPCGDSSTWSKNKDPSKSCDWVAELPEARCLVKDASTVLAAEACKATCGSCGTCVDEPGWHKVATGWVINAGRGEAATWVETALPA